MALPQKVFPIKSETACQLKWSWSTLFLTTEETASCHRTNMHRFDTSSFNFHNTPTKLEDRERMLVGKWPNKGCNYCKNIEAAGGQSDRITNLDFRDMHAPPELDINPTAINVTPRILEIYFDNTCNLKCLYCGPQFSSLWEAENRKHGSFNDGKLVTTSDWQKSKNIESNKQKIFEWLKVHGHNLTNFNVLGGEPLYQKEFEQCLDLFEQHPAPHLKLQIFTNLNTKLAHLKEVITRVKKLIALKKIAGFEVTASLDCWGAPQEYVRFPLNLVEWEENFNYLLSQRWINLIISSTVTPLTIKTLPNLLEKVNQWNTIRPVYHYQNSIGGPSPFYIDIFGDIFLADFDRALALKPTIFPEDISKKEYLRGIAQQSASTGPRLEEITKMYHFLNEMDRRRNTNWREVFPWLVNEFKKHNVIEA